MAGIQASGVGSGLDINSLVSQLVSAEGAPLAQRITRHEVAVTTKVSALGSLKGALSAFKAALDPLKSIDVFRARKATSGDTDFFTVSADANAVAGHYDVEVENLAQAHQLASDPFQLGSSAPVGYGDLKISMGDESFTVTIEQGKTKLSDIRNAINDASDNTGVQATILTGTEGARLVLTSSKTGADNAITVESIGGDDGLDVFNYDPDGVKAMDESREAKNAFIRISGFPVESDTNVFEDAIDGVTITAKKAELGTKNSLDIAFDVNGVVSKVQAFVTQYNTMQAALAKLGSYDANTKVAGPLLGDSILRGVEDQMRRSLTSPVTGASGTYTTLASVGIKTSATGVLELDAAKLRSALDADPEGVAALFGSDDGVAARLSSQLTDRLASNGDIESRNKRLTDELKGITKDKEALNLRMAQIEARYRKQFTALDTLLSQMQSTSNYLSQQLSSAAKTGQ